jgi:hypothetical protein
MFLCANKFWHSNQYQFTACVGYHEIKSKKPGKIKVTAKSDGLLVSQITIESR